jgi:hypothetical protein
MQNKGFEIWKLLFTVFAIVISTISLLLSLRQNRRTAKTGMRPILTFIFDEEKGWMIRNVGMGPALDIVICKLPVFPAHWGLEFSSTDFPKRSKPFPNHLPICKHI